MNTKLTQGMGVAYTLTEADATRSAGDNKNGPKAGDVAPATISRLARTGGPIRLHVAPRNGAAFSVDDAQHGDGPGKFTADLGTPEPAPETPPPAPPKGKGKSTAPTTPADAS
jgi:hypothetical protein